MSPSFWNLELTQPGRGCRKTGYTEYYKQDGLSIYNAALNLPFGSVQVHNDGVIGNH